MHLRIIEEETQSCPPSTLPPYAALAEMAGSLTFGSSPAAHRLVRTWPPTWRAWWKEAGRRDAHVRTFTEPSGNAGMIARELPGNEVLASWQHIEQRALDLGAAGIPGTLEDSASGPT